MRIKIYVLPFKTRMIAGFAAIILAFVFAPVFFPSVGNPYWFHDSFFNTLKIAENFRLKGVPTFDGITPTNDFSLLWGGMLSGLSAVVSSKTTVFLIIVRLLIGSAAALSLFLFNRLLDALQIAFSKEMRFAASSFLLALFFYSALSGSDAALAIPVVFLNALCLLKALKTPSFFSGCLAGLVVSLCAFTRFDSMVFAITAFFVLYFQFNSQYPLSKKQLAVLVAGVVAGLIPLMVYADFMQGRFGSPVPAEVLSWEKVQDMEPWRIFVLVFFEPIRYAFRMPHAAALITFPVLLLLLVAHVSFPWKGENRDPQNTVFYALIWFPIVYLTGIAFLTFVSLPEYVFYSFAVGAPFALMFAMRKIDSQISENEQRTARRVWRILGCLFMVVSLSLSLKPRSVFYKPAVQTIDGFVAQNSGRYAMSVPAGITSFVTGADIVRLDGAGEDMFFLKMIDVQETLRYVLLRYEVDYYIALNLQKGDRCYSAREPAQNRFGGTNKGMSDWLCAEPVFEKQATPEFKVSVFKIDASGRAVSP